MPPTNNTADDPVLSVAELTRGLSDLVEDRYDDVWVEGELSDFTRAASGHCYFSLKDEDAQIRCVMWKHLTKYVYFEPEEGMQVRVNGHASVYERRGDLQIQAQAMRQAGKGAQQKAFEELKQTLQAEGLFAPERKQALPAFPDTIGVVTSGQGAAIHDIQSGLARRFPPAEVVLCPVKVQGLDAPRAVADAVAAFNDLPADDAQRPDLLIVGRGGGSTEDLWAFNEEVVARALDASNLPVVSAVGHESDVTIADLVADERAATPSAAAERVVPDRRDVATACAPCTTASAPGSRAASRMPASASTRSWRRGPSTPRPVAWSSTDSTSTPSWTDWGGAAPGPSTGPARALHISATACTPSTPSSPCAGATCTLLKTARPSNPPSRFRTATGCGSISRTGIATPRCFRTMDDRGGPPLQAPSRLSPMPISPAEDVTAS